MSGEKVSEGQGRLEEQKKMQEEAWKKGSCNWPIRGDNPRDWMCALKDLQEVRSKLVPAFCSQEAQGERGGRRVASESFFVYSSHKRKNEKRKKGTKGGCSLLSFFSTFALLITLLLTLSLSSFSFFILFSLPSHHRHRHYKTTKEHKRQQIPLSTQTTITPPHLLITHCPSLTPAKPIREQPQPWLFLLYPTLL